MIQSVWYVNIQKSKINTLLEYDINIWSKINPLCTTWHVLTKSVLKFQAAINNCWEICKNVKFVVSLTNRIFVNFDHNWRSFVGQLICFRSKWAKLAPFGPFEIYIPWYACRWQHLYSVIIYSLPYQWSPLSVNGFSKLHGTRCILRWWQAPKSSYFLGAECFLH